MMRIIKIFLLCLFVLKDVFVMQAFSQAYSRKQFADVLKATQKIENPRHVRNTFFSDLGAWHGFSLPQEPEDYGSFIGPVVMDLDGVWVANAFAKIEVKENGLPKDLTQAQLIQHYYPGMLQQSFVIDSLEITQRLLFVTNRSSLSETRIRNLAQGKRELLLAVEGRVFPNNSFSQSEGCLMLEMPNPEFVLKSSFSNQVVITVSEDKLSYKADMGLKTLKGNVETSFVQSISYHLAKATLPDFNMDFSSSLMKNEQRWDAYLNSYFSNAPVMTLEKQRLAVKSIITLITNWRSAMKDLHHDGVFPSVNYQGFYGVWSWDSWKQAVALAMFHPRLAKDNIRCMFDYTDERGMVADCIYTDQKENNWRDTKPPLAAWAVYNVFELTGDLAFVEEMFPKLEKYHGWWYADRDTDRNGLCEYGSTDGTRIAAAWESGMDNAVRFDSAVMVKSHAAAWSLNQESVDLNAYLYAEKMYLAQLARLLKLPQAAKWEQEANALKPRIHAHFYDENKGYYYDRMLGGKSLIRIEGPEGWIPLWAGIADENQAARVMHIMKEPEKFNTKVPLPTLAADHPGFDPLKGYWRGPVWLDQFYFGVAGLKRYGYHELADEMIQKLFANAQGMLSDYPLCENYHPLSGQCLNARNFSWSAAHVLMLLNPAIVK